MATKRKNNLTYNISTEGDDEVWYLEHLEKLINEHPKAKYKVKFITKPAKPTSFVKRVDYGYGETFYHICDVEDPDKIDNFKSNIDLCKQAKEYKDLKDYQLYYSNICFELWIILHKTAKTPSLTDKKKYLDAINKLYGLKIKSFDKIKKEENFIKILSQIDNLDYVITAINTAKALREKNLQNQTTQFYRNVKFTQHNPDLTIHELIEKILQEVGIL